MLKNRFFSALAFAGMISVAACGGEEAAVVEEPVAEEQIAPVVEEPAVVAPEAGVVAPEAGVEPGLEGGAVEGEAVEGAVVEPGV